MISMLKRLTQQGKTSIEALNETAKFYGLTQDEALGLWEKFIDG